MTWQQSVFIDKEVLQTKMKSEARPSIFRYTTVPQQSPVPVIKTQSLRVPQLRIVTVMGFLTTITIKHRHCQH